MKQCALLVFIAMAGMNLVFSSLGQAQTALVPGDIAITGFNMDNPDEISVVFLVDIATGTEIRFTDNGWKADGTFRTGEGTDIWVAEMDYAAGEEVIITVSDMALSSSGDQVLVYQGSEEAPLFVAAVNDEGEHVWQEDAVDASTSALPAGLIDGFTCVALTETDNMVYNRSVVSGTREQLLSSIHDYQQWAGSNTERQMLSISGYTILDNGSQPVQWNIVNVNGGIDPYVNAPFSISVETVDSAGYPCAVDQNTILLISLVNGSGTLYGNTQDTLPAGQSALTVNGIQYSVAEDDITIKAETLSGILLESDTSEPFSVLPLPDIIISEIHYNGPETGTDTTEFIEIHHGGTEAVILGGYTFSQGITFTFPDTAVIGPGEYIVVACSADNYDGQGFQVYQWFSGTLSNTGETIELQNNLGQMIDQVTYSDGNEWGNCAPDGYGPSLELIDMSLGNDDPGNWKASHNNGGTPGEANSQAPFGAIWAGGFADQGHNWAVPSNWLNGQSAGASTLVTIPENVVEQLVIDNTFSCRQLLMEPGAFMTVDQGDTLCVQQSVSLLTDSNHHSSLVLEDDLATVMVSGSSSIQLYLSGGTTRDPENAVYHFVSSPVTSVSAGQVFPGSAYLRRYNEPLQLWENLAWGDFLQPLNGYSVWLEAGSAMVTFTGGFNSGVLLMDGLTYTGPGIPSYNADYAGYHLIGNPYPSAINWDHPSIVKNQIADAIYFWNPEVDGYSTYINGIGNNPETTDSIVPSMQGFFVRTEAPGQTGSIAFSNDCRVHRTNEYYKKTDRSWPVFRMNASGNGKQDQTSFCIRQGSTTGFDPAYDAFKLPGSSGVPQLYSIASDGSHLSVNTLPFWEDLDQVMVGFSMDASGSYQLTFNGLDTFPENLTILLEDLLTDSVVNCRVISTYAFDWSAGDDPERFLLHITFMTGYQEVPDQQVQLYTQGHQLFLYTTERFNDATVRLYDLTGRLIRQECLGGRNNFIIPVREARGWVVVQIISSFGSITEKVYLQ